MMARLSTLCALLIVLVGWQQVMAGRQVVEAGGVFRLTCHFRELNPSRYIIQFYRDKAEVKMFNSRHYTDELRLVSNGTTIVPAITNHTDRYSVEANGDFLDLVIKNVTDSDSAWYGCFRFNLVWNEPKASQGSIELLVPGPFDGIFWTANYTNLNLDRARQNAIPDGGVVQADQEAFSADVACVVLVSNVQPVVHITVGRFGEPGSVDITQQFDTRIASVTSDNSGGWRYRATVFFVRPFKYARSLRDVFCRAAVLGKTYETSVNIQVKTKPTIGACEPMFFTAMVGSKNVNLTCLIEAHPEPYVEWILPGGRKINALSNNPNYTVTNVPRIEGVLTMLTISEVIEDGSTFGWYEINATNTEGSGGRYLELTEGDLVGAAGVVRSPATLITVTTLLIYWMQKSGEP